MAIKTVTTEPTTELLPPVGVQRLGKVKTLTGLSRSTLYRKMADGTFPQAVKLGERAIGWRNADINAFLRSL